MAFIAAAFFLFKMDRLLDGVAAFINFYILSIRSKSLFELLSLCFEGKALSVVVCRIIWVDCDSLIEIRPCFIKPT